MGREPPSHCETNPNPEKCRAMTEAHSQKNALLTFDDAAV